MPVDVVFSHANGIPAKAYGKFFSFLKDVHLKYINAYGMGKFPIDVNWRSSVKELIAFVESNFKGPVTALGHSFGGVISLFALGQRPDLFKQVIAIEPPLFEPKKRWAIGITRLLGMENLAFKLPALARGRKNDFTSKEEALEYFKRRSFFKNFDPQILQDYINYGLEEGQGRFKLAIPPSVEAEIFRFVPCFFLPNFDQIRPCHILYSKSKALERDKGPLKWLCQRLPMAQFMAYEGGHMGPLENPKRMAELINGIIS